MQIAVNSEANARRIQMVESCFGSSGEQLLIPGRVLVGEGVLTKMCRKRPKPRQFFLFNDILVYGNIIIGKKKYNKQHIIPLEEVQLQGLDDTPRELSIVIQIFLMFWSILNFFFSVFLFSNSIRHTQRLVDSNDSEVFCSLCCYKYWKTRVDGAYQQVHRGFTTKKSVGNLMFIKAFFIHFFKFKVAKNVQISTQQFGYPTMKRTFACAVKRRNLRWSSADIIVETAGLSCAVHAPQKNSYYRPAQSHSECAWIVTIF